MADKYAFQSFPPNRVFSQVYELTKGRCWKKLRCDPGEEAAGVGGRHSHSRADTGHPEISGDKAAGDALPIAIATLRVLADLELPAHR
jgi:hypothetical protein